MSIDGQKVKPTYDGFVIIPNPILQAEGLTLGAKILFGVIWSLSHGSAGKCFAGNEQLARRAGNVNLSRMRGMLRALERAKLIKRCGKDPRHRDEITILWTGQPVVIKRPRKTARKPANGDGAKSTNGDGAKSTNGDGAKSTTENLDEKRVEKKTACLPCSSPSASHASRTSRPSGSPSRPRSNASGPRLPHGATTKHECVCKRHSRQSGRQFFFFTRRNTDVRQRMAQRVHRQPPGPAPSG
jgi:hypothetical protein